MTKNNIKIIFIYLFIFILFYGCNFQEDQTIVVHPLYDQFPPDSSLNDIIDLYTTQDFESELVLFQKEKLKSNEIVTDSAFSDNYYFYQTPHNAEFDKFGNSYIVQRHTNSVNVYDETGNFIYSIGGGGQGPGEFQRIGTFDFTPDYEKLYVLDFFKIEIFKLKDDRYEYHNTVQLNMNRVYDLCVLDDYFFVSGYKFADPDHIDSIRESTNRQDQISKLERIRVSGPIHRFSRDSSEPDIDFGFKYRTYSNFGPYNGMISETRLHCDELTGVVIGKLAYFPYIFGYNQDGYELWVSKINGFESIQTIEEINPIQGPTIAQYSNDDIFNFHYRFKNFISGYVLIQIGYGTPQRVFAKENLRTIPEQRYKSFLVDPLTGNLSKLDINRIVGSLNYGRMMLVDIDYETAIHKFEIYDFDW